MFRSHIALIPFALMLTAPAGAEPPAFSSLACSVQTERADWSDTLERTQRRWGVSTEVQLALIADEWGISADTLPSGWRPGWTDGRRREPGIAPGYFDATWDRYEFETGNRNASYKSFDDFSDFIGWYVSSAAESVRLLPGDAVGVYILWKKGPRYYASNQWSYNPSLIARAEQFARETDLIALDLASPHCVTVEDPSFTESVVNVFRPWNWRQKRGEAVISE